MKDINTQIIRIFVADYNKIKEIAKVKDRKYIQILSFAIKNYWQAVIGNRLNKSQKKNV